MVLRQPECRQDQRPEQRQAELRTVGRQRQALQCSGRGQVPPLQRQQVHGEPRGHGGQQVRGGQQEHDEQQGHGGRRGRDGRQGRGGEQHGSYAVTGGTLQCRGEPDHGIGHLQLRDGLPIQ